MVKKNQHFFIMIHRLNPENPVLSRNITQCPKKYLLLLNDIYTNWQLHYITCIVNLPWGWGVTPSGGAGNITSFDIVEIGSSKAAPTDTAREKEQHQRDI